MKSTDYSPLSLRMEASPGSDISDCFDQALTIAMHVGANVVFDFNGVHCGVRPRDAREPKARDWFLAAFHRELTGQSKAKVCYANP